MDLNAILHESLTTIKEYHDVYTSGKLEKVFGTRYRTNGICGLVQRENAHRSLIESNLINKHLQQCTREWPEFSGNCAFPVPSDDCDPETAYFSCPEIMTPTEYRWDTSKSQYAINRVALLDFLIDLTKPDES